MNPIDALYAAYCADKARLEAALIDKDLEIEAVMYSTPCTM